MFGDKGVKIVKPEVGYPVRPSDVEVDEDNDEIEDYDENVVRRKRHNIKSQKSGMRKNWIKRLQITCDLKAILIR